MLMIAPAKFTAPQRVLPLWAGGLLCLVVLCVAADFELRHVAHARAALDYRRPLAQVARMWDAPDFSAAEAKEAIDESISLAPDHPEPQVLLGHLHYRLQQWRSAITAYEKAIALGTQEKGIQQNIVWCYVELGEYEEAAEHGEQALAEGFNGPLLHRYTGEAYYRNENLDDSRKHFEAALAATPEDSHLMNRLLMVYMKQGDSDAVAAMDKRLSDAEARLGAIGETSP